MERLEAWTRWYYGHWPQYVAMGGCVALIVLGHGHSAIQIAGVVLLPVTVMAPAALEIASTFTADPGEDS